MLRGTIFAEASVDPELLKGQKFTETVFWHSSPNTPKLLEKAILEAAGGSASKTLLDFRLSSAKKSAVELCIQPIGDPPERLFFSGQKVSDREESVEYYKSEVDQLLFAAENLVLGPGERQDLFDAEM
jgi:hypothetical protein